MDDKKYYLSIVNEDGELYGHLSDIGFDDDKNRFNPLTVLSDLLDMVFDYERISSEEWAIRNYSFKETYQQHPFFQDGDIRHKIEIYQQKIDQVVKFNDEVAGLMVYINSFIVCASRVHKCLLKRESISLTELELIKALNQYQYTFEVEERHKNPHYRFGGSLYKKYEEEGTLYIIDRLGYDTESEFEYLAVRFGPDVDEELWQGFLDETENPVRFAYTCYSIEDVLFAVWHYLILHNYTKFHQCPHCGCYFATKSLRGYCNRKSPYKGYGYLANAYKGYGDLNCKLAVDRMKEQLTKRKGKVCEYLQTHYGSSVRHKFEDEYVLLKDAVKNCPSVENIKKLDLFLAIDEVQNTWYKDEYKE